MKEVAAQYDFVEVFSLGQSFQGRDVMMMTIKRNPGDNNPGIFIDSSRFHSVLFPRVLSLTPDRHSRPRVDYLCHLNLDDQRNADERRSSIARMGLPHNSCPEPWSVGSPS